MQGAGLRRGAEWPEKASCGSRSWAGVAERTAHGHRGALPAFTGGSLRNGSGLIQVWDYWCLTRGARPLGAVLTCVCMPVSSCLFYVKSRNSSGASMIPQSWGEWGVDV